MPQTAKTIYNRSLMAEKAIAPEVIPEVTKTKCDIALAASQATCHHEELDTSSTLNTKEDTRKYGYIFLGILAFIGIMLIWVL